MRRARISIKPNVRPGGRSVAPAAEGKSGQESTAVDDTQQTASPSSQSQPEVKESTVARGDGNIPGSPSEKASLNTNDRAPSSAKTPATPALQRRTRFSATPNLTRPKVRSAAPPASAGKTASLPSESSKTSPPFQTAKSFPRSPVPVTADDSQNSKLTDATTVAHCPSNFGSPESPPSTPSHQELCKTPLKSPNKDVEPQEGASTASGSPYLKLSRVDGPGSPLRDKIFSDKDRVLRVLKLKELMKLERRKESMKQNGRRKHEHCYEMDRDKMTLADFIYYLPETNPMKSSLSTEETQTAQTTTTNVPPSPTVQKKITEADEDDEEDDDDVLVPKVKVAEDGSLILDEESLTVRVQRMSDTVVENANPLFERGSTTTYRSFRKHYTVKTWSVRETDMFYLAISMVGTDFSMMAQLLTHRNRAEIKHKFRKEEKENSWRVDKAFRDKRPYDAKFFSFLLKRILAKDKEKGSAIKLVIKPKKARRRKDKGGKKAKEIVEEFCDDNDHCDEVCSADSVVSFDLEKENEDCSNVKEADVPSSKKRKRKKDDKPCVKTSKKTTRKGKCSVEDEDGDLVCVDNDLVKVDSEDQSCMSVLKKKCKQSKKGAREEQKEKANAKEKSKKKKKKALKVRYEEPADGESKAVNEENIEASTVPTKKRKRSKKRVKEDEETTQRKPKTKKSKTSQEVCSVPELGADGGEVSTAAASAEDNQGVKLNPDSTAQEKNSQSSSKRSKRPLPNLLKRKAKKCTEPEAAVEHKEAVPEDETLQDAENESRILRLAEEQLHNQPVVVLERTPPREELNPDTAAQEEISQSSSKRSKRPLPNLLKRKAKKCTEPKAAVEHEDAVEEPEDENLQDAENESRIFRLAEEQLQNQPGVVLERTPPREELSPDTAAQEEISQSSSKRSKRPLPNLLTRKAKKCTEPKAAVEHEDAVEEPEDENLQDAENESRILRLAEEQLQNQPVVILERTPPRLKDPYNSSESQCGPLSPKSPQQSPGRQMRAEKVKRNLTAANDGSTDLGCEEDHSEKLNLEEVSQSSSRCSPRWQTGAVKVKPSLTPSEREKMDQCQTRSDSSVEDMSSTAMPDQVVSQDSEVIEESASPGRQGRRKKSVQMSEFTSKGFNLQHLEFLNSSGVNGQPSLKRAVVSVSHEEVKHYLRIQTQSKAEESTSSDMTPARGHHVGEHRESSSVTVFQVPEIKKPGTAPISAQQSITATRRRVLKPRPSLSRAAQSSHRPQLSENTLSLKHNSTPLECSNPFEDQVKLTANENLEEVLRDCPEEEDTHSVSPEENSPYDVKDDDSPSLTSVDVPERRTELEKSPSQTSENQDQISDEEIIDAIMKRIIPVSWMSDEALCQFEKPTANLEWESQVTANPQETSGPNKDPAEISEHQSSVRDQRCDLDQNREPFSLVSSVVDLQQCKQDKDLLCPVPLLSSMQTPVPVDSASAKKKKNNPVFSHASSVPFESLDSSFSDHATQHTSNLYDTDTVMFSVPAEENTQIDNQDSTEKLSSVFESWSGNSKSEVSDSAEVETGATDIQSEEEPTFILTLYEIPTSQLFGNAASGQQDTLPYDLQPAQIQTPSRFTGSSQSLSFTSEASSASSQMASEEPEIPCESVSHTDDSLVPLSKDPTDGKDTRIHLISSQESSCDGVNSLISASERLSCSSAMPTDVPNLDEIRRKTAETKAPTQRRSKIKVKPKLKPCVKAGPSRNYQSDSAHSQSLPSSHAKTQTEAESDQKSSAQETVDPNILSHPEDSERKAHPGHDSVVSVITVPVSEEMRDEIPLRADHQMDEDSIDLPVHSTGVKESKDETDGGCEGVSHMVLADAFMFSSGEMDNVFNKETDNSHGGELQEHMDLSVRLPERAKILPAVFDQKEKMADTPENLDTCKVASSELSSTSQEKSKPYRRATAQIISPVPLIKDELEERTAREDLSEEELDTRSSRHLTPFTSKKTLACIDSRPVELKIEGGHEDVMHTVLCDIFVPVSNETEDDSPQTGEESQQSLHEEDTQSHVLLTDILNPVREDIGDHLSQDWMTARERTSHDAERPQVREESQSSHVKPSVSPKWNRAAQRKDKFLVKMTFPKRKPLLDSPNSVEQSEAVSPSSLKSEQEADASLKAVCISEPKLAAQCSVETITSGDLLLTSSEGREEVCGGVSQLVLSDIAVAVLDDSAEKSLNKEASLAGLQEGAVKKSPSASPSVSVEWKTPSCRRATLRPKPNLSKRIDNPSQTDLHSSSSAQTSLATTQQSLDHQAEEWSLKSNMLPMDSDEIENWCEGVSHMLMSDAFVPASEEVKENSTNLKAFVSSSPHNNEECGPSMGRKTTSGISDQTRQTDTTTDMPKTEESKESRPAPLANKSPTRSTFQMTLRSPERRLKDQPHVLKSPQAAPTTPQRTQISTVRGSVGSPTREHIGELSNVCRVQLERLSVEEICAAQSVLQPKHHNTPVTVKTTSRGNEMHKGSLALLGSRSPGFESQADEEPHVPPGYSPKVVLQRITVTDTDASTSMPASSPARVPTGSRTPGDQQSPQNSFPGADADKNPVQVSQFFLDDIFTEVVDAD